MTTYPLSWRATRPCLTTFAALALGCGAGTSDRSVAEPAPTTLQTARDALAADVAACGQAFEACAETVDAGKPDACLAELESCREAAVETAASSLGSMAKGCAEELQTCHEGEPARACQEQLASCLGVSADTETDDDAGADDVAPEHGDTMSPVGSCVDALRSCLEDGNDARACTEPLPHCLRGAVAQSSGEPDRETPDHAKPDDDATEDADAGATSGDDSVHEQEPGDPSAADDAGDSLSARDCADAFDACAAAGMSRKECAATLRDCQIAP